MLSHVFWVMKYDQSCVVRSLKTGLLMSSNDINKQKMFWKNIFVHLVHLLTTSYNLSEAETNLSWKNVYIRHKYCLGLSKCMEHRVH